MQPSQTKPETLRQPAYDIDPVFIQRWSPRSFANKDVPEETLFSLFEAARWAPSANNMQPWRFIVARTKEDLETFHSFILPGNLAWCRNAPALARTPVFEYVEGEEQMVGKFPWAHPIKPASS